LLATLSQIIQGKDSKKAITNLDLDPLFNTSFGGNFKNDYPNTRDSLAQSILNSTQI